MMRIVSTLLTAEVPANKLPNLRHKKQICCAEKICRPEQHNKQPEPGQAIQTYTAALLSSALDGLVGSSQSSLAAESPEQPASILW
jgi:hypothetical protein